MSYVPGHLELLDRSGTVDGWPKGISEASKEFAVSRVKAGLEKYGQMDLDTARRCIYDHYIDNEPVPEDLKGVLWDFLYAVTYRALLAASARTVFVAEQRYGLKKNEGQWYPVKVSQADVEAVESKIFGTSGRGSGRSRLERIVGSLKAAIGSNWRKAK